ncbi:hypothetical protein BS78_03G174200 [Paspalum vaginatum]|nr:hypothetical protein BS78_03G174200 [Paspalum vaginatum]
MVSKFAFAALVLVMALGGQLAHAVPLRRVLIVDWTNGMRGGAPGGMQPSDTKLTHAGAGQKGSIYTGAEQGKFIYAVPTLVRPPRLPPS